MFFAQLGCRFLPLPASVRSEAKTILTYDLIPLWRPYLASFILIKRSQNLSSTTQLEQSSDRILCPRGFSRYSTVQVFGPLFKTILAQALQLLLNNKELILNSKSYRDPSAFSVHNYMRGSLIRLQLRSGHCFNP